MKYTYTNIKSKSIVLTIFLFFIVFGLFAQQDVRFTINHKLGQNSFLFNAEAENDLGHKFKLTRLEYYISDISIIHDGGKDTTLSEVYILTTAEKNDTILLGKLNVTTIESISFSIGVDPSVNNNDPTLWPSEHPLAPKQPSMHWGWSSGYRFVALEGKSGSSFSQDFQIHALGNKNFFKQNIPVEGKEMNNGLLISLNADYTQALAGIDMNSGLIEHGEDNEAAKFLMHFQNRVFTNDAGLGNTLAGKDLDISNALTVYPNPSSGTITIQLDNNKFENADLEITNAIGKTLIKQKMGSSFKTLTIDNSGLYILTIRKDNLLSTKKLIIQ